MIERLAAALSEISQVHVHMKARNDSAELRNRRDGAIREYTRRRKEVDAWAAERLATRTVVRRSDSPEAERQRRELLAAYSNVATLASGVAAATRSEDVGEMLTALSRSKSVEGSEESLEAILDESKRLAVTLVSAINLRAERANRRLPTASGIRHRFLASGGGLRKGPSVLFGLAIGVPLASALIAPFRPVGPIVLAASVSGLILTAFFGRGSDDGRAEGQDQGQLIANAKRLAYLVTAGLQQLDRPQTQIVSPAIEEARRVDNEKQQRILELQAAHKAALASLDQQRHKDVEDARMALDEKRDGLIRLAREWGELAPDSWQESYSPDAPHFLRVGDFLPNEHLPVDIPIVLPIDETSVIWLRHESVSSIPTQEVKALVLSILAKRPPGSTDIYLIDPRNFGALVSDLLPLNEGRAGSVNVVTQADGFRESIGDLWEGARNTVQQKATAGIADYDRYVQAANLGAGAYKVLAILGFPEHAQLEDLTRLRELIGGASELGISIIIAAPNTPDSLRLNELGDRALVIENGARGPTDWAVKSRGLSDKGRVTLRTAPQGAELAALLAALSGAAREQLEQVVELPLVPFVQGAVVDTGNGRLPNYSMEARRRCNTIGGVRIPLGDEGGGEPLWLELGGQSSSHALVLGATNSGKSYLLHAMIASGALIYPPDELEYYLIDLKQGVEFQAYAELPHARAIVMDVDTRVAGSVIAELLDEMQRRAARFTDQGMFGTQGVADIDTYRTEVPGERMPRIMLVIDEFQVLFEDSKGIGGQIREQLSTLVRQGRAYGIHVVLVTQAITGFARIGISDVKNQFGVRISLMARREDAAEILDAEGTTMTQELAGRGQAIYNGSFGRDGANKRFQTASVSDTAAGISKSEGLAQVVGTVRQEMSQRAMHMATPYVLSPQRIPIVQDCAALDELTEFATRPGQVGLLIGQSLRLESGLILRLAQMERQHLLVLGGVPRERTAVMLAASLGFSASAGQGGQIFGADFSPRSAEHTPIQNLIQGLGEANARLTTDVGTFAEWLEELAVEIDDRRDQAHRQYASTLVVAHGLDRVELPVELIDGEGVTQYEVDPYYLDLEKVLRDGPAVGIHLAVSASSGRELDDRFKPFLSSVSSRFEHQARFGSEIDDVASYALRSSVRGFDGGVLVSTSQAAGEFRLFRPLGLKAAVAEESRRVR